MTKDELKMKLDSALDNFVEETKRLDDYGQNPVSEGELKEFAKQVFYAMDAFKDSLLEYLD